ncbi:MAG TPA: hypothetical protein VGC21_12410 [Telluria sp.]|jgi:hypothetical protein
MEPTTDLARHQRILLGLIRANYAVAREDHPYFHQVAASPDLQEARGNIYLWRVYVLERTCVLTMALLRQRGLLEAALEAFIRSRNVSPFREYQPLAFLASLAEHPDPLLVSVSQFELALMKVREGDPGSYTVAWATDPHSVLHCLAQNVPLEPCGLCGAWRTRVAADLPHLFDVQHGG